MKRKVGVAPAEWDDDRMRSWARAKHISRVYAQVGIQLAEVEERNIQEIPLAIQFQNARTLEEKVNILGRSKFGIGEEEIMIIRGKAADEVLVDDEGAVDVAWCRVEGCDQGQENGPKFFDNEGDRDAHEARHVSETPQPEETEADVREAEAVGV